MNTCLACDASLCPATWTSIRQGFVPSGHGSVGPPCPASGSSCGSWNAPESAETEEMKCVCCACSLPCVCDFWAQFRAQAKLAAGAQRVGRRRLALTGPRDRLQPPRERAGSILCCYTNRRLNSCPELHIKNSGLPNRSGLCRVAAISFIPGAAEGAPLPCLWGSRLQR